MQRSVRDRGVEHVQADYAAITAQLRLIYQTLPTHAQDLQRIELTLPEMK
jgi:hypothetical protein